MTPTPFERAYSRRRDHSRAKRTWSATASPRSNAPQSPIQYGCVATKSSSSRLSTGASGSARRPFQAAKADRAAYGELCSSGGPSGRIDHQDWPARASQSTNRYSSSSIRPDAMDVGCKRMPADRRRSTKPPFTSACDLKRCASMPVPKTAAPPARIQIQKVTPQVDCGRYPLKRTIGDRVEVSATIFRDGHEQLGAALRYKLAGATRWQEVPLEPLGNDLWSGSFPVDRCGTWCYRVEAWVDRIASFQEELRRKVDAGQKDLSSELAEGGVLLGDSKLTVEDALAADAADRFGKAWSSTYAVDVDRAIARFGSWYELFPRSWGGFSGVTAVLPELAGLGFDVVYLPPIHPIGTSNRKGRNNALKARSSDPGSPWAIGSELGGHDAIDPELGTLDDFERMIAAANELGVEIALDFAIQCSPDHPWLKQHPEWFNRRPDGTLKYAENPPKKYQDIYKVNFDSEDWKGLW